ncbi:uncharacterized protein MYCFIDRAFT_174640 [Pseudocercospora fijiensis CIRAD86]|uniref:Uncharacterized protein n=1 Tax=Pseudocercospora fijiensis (strain CIRAD86) TaxID=383855 RepID=M3B167_PSEFD|nr:uncharacterized protein MYCFIDRAFT_174640 [Pseudocercospora fijiensis CIRAD86]EME83162.1 hypothetical protein MYCFIDRAFT_174640 [Pseudocercospora fijiensis CIRAD86]
MAAGFARTYLVPEHLILRLRPGFDVNSACLLGFRSSMGLTRDTAFGTLPHAFAETPILHRIGWHGHWYTDWAWHWISHSLASQTIAGVVHSRPHPLKTTSNGLTQLDNVRKWNSLGEIEKNASSSAKSVKDEVPPTDEEDAIVYTQERHHCRSIRAAEEHSSTSARSSSQSLEERLPNTNGVSSARALLRLVPRKHTELLAIKYPSPIETAYWLKLQKPSMSLPPRLFPFYDRRPNTDRTQLLTIHKLWLIQIADLLFRQNTLHAHKRNSTININSSASIGVTIESYTSRLERCPSSSSLNVAITFKESTTRCPFALIPEKEPAARILLGTSAETLNQEPHQPSKAPRPRPECTSLPFTQFAVMYQGHTTTMDQSPFFKLSPELRNLVYEYAVTQSDASVKLLEKQPGLTMTCRKIRQECLLLFYSLNTFRLEVPQNNSQALAQRLQSSTLHTDAGGERLRSIQKLAIIYHLSSLENQPVVPGCKNEGGWVRISETLAEMGFSKDQVVWKTQSTSFLDSSLGGNYLAYLAETARLRMYDHIIQKGWEEISDSMVAAKASSQTIWKLDRPS